MKRSRISIAALSVVAIIVSACGGGTAPSGAAPGTAAAGDLPTLTFVAQIDNPSQAFSWKMYQKNAAKYGFNVSVCDNKNDVQQQTTCINDAVAQGVDAIAINPKDEVGYVPATKAAMAAGVVVCLSMVPPAAEALDGSTCSVSVDDILGGKTAAEAIIKAFPNGATGVEIGGQAGHVAANNRHAGFTKGIEGKNITVLDYQNPSAWDTAEAQAIAEDMITKYGDKIQFIFCHWDNGATGVINALKAVEPALGERRPDHRRRWQQDRLRAGRELEELHLDRPERRDDHLQGHGAVHALDQEGSVGREGEHHPVRHHQQGNDRELHRSRVVKS